MTVELLGAEAFLAVPSENHLHGGVAAFHRLKRRQGRVHPIFGQVVQNGVGLLAGRHAPNGNRRPCGYHRCVATHAKRLDLAVGDHVEIDGQRYEVVPDRMGGVTIEPPITPIAELDEQQGTKPASAEEFERLTASDPSDGEG